MSPRARDLSAVRPWLVAAVLLAGIGCAGAGSGDGSGGAGGGAGSGGAGAGGGAAGGSSGQGGAAGGGATGGNNGGGGAGTGAGGAGATGGAGGVSPGACPAGALFCSGFEEASGLPAGATLQDPDESGGGTTTFAPMMTLDRTAPFDGAQSLKVMSDGSFHFRMLGVAVPATFWVRLFIKSDQDIGQEGHNAFFQAMTAADYHTSTHSVEVAEQFTCILLNDHDTLFPTANTCGANVALPKDTWHCMEAKFDGATGNVQVFANKTLIVDAAAWPPAQAAFTMFEFGYASYHLPAASVWYDDVVVAPTRVGCP